MTDDEDTGTRLGQKLAALDLAEDEAALLVTILGGQVEGEVEGFWLIGKDDAGDVVTQIAKSSWFDVNTFTFTTEH